MPAPPEPYETAVVVRGYGHAHTAQRARRAAPATWHSDLVVVLDNETRTDHTQRLLFGSARLHRPTEFIREWLYYPDDLSAAELAVLERYVRKHADDVGGHIRLLPVTTFLRRVFARLAYKERALVTGWNLPFDLSRFAVEWRPAEDSFAGGFSLRLFEWTDPSGAERRDLYLPDLRISAKGKRERIGLAGAARAEPWHKDGERYYRGRFLDLHQLAYALTDRSYTLEAAAVAWGVAERKAHVARHGVLTDRYVSYCRQDVRTTYALYEALIADWRRHPIADAT